MTTQQELRLEYLEDRISQIIKILATGKAKNLSEHDNLIDEHERLCEERDRLCAIQDWERVLELG